MDIEQAQKAIAAILCRLEESTGSVVESLDVVTTDVAPISSARAELVRSIRIVVRPLPGTMWDK